MTHSSNSQVMGAAVFGGLLGAGLAILFAPRSGRETRQQIHDGINRAQDEANAKIEGVKTKMRKQLSESKKSPVMSAWEEEV